MNLVLSPEHYLYAFYNLINTNQYRVRPNIITLTLNVFVDLENNFIEIYNNLTDDNNSILTIISKLNLLNYFKQTYLSIINNYTKSIVEFNKLLENMMNKIEYFKEECIQYKNQYIKRQESFKRLLDINKELFDKKWEDLKEKFLVKLFNVNNYRLTKQILNIKPYQWECNDIVYLNDDNFPLEKDQSILYFKTAIEYCSEKQNQEIDIIQSGDKFLIYPKYNFYNNFKIDLIKSLPYFITAATATAQKYIGTPQIISTSRNIINTAAIQTLKATLNTQYNQLGGNININNSPTEDQLLKYIDFYPKINLDFLSYIFGAYLYLKFKEDQDQANLQILNTTIFKSLKNINTDLKDRFIFDKIKEHYNNSLKKMILEKLKDIIKNNKFKTKIFSTAIGTAYSQYIKQFSFENLYKEFEEPLNANIQNINIRDLKILNDISDYNLLISNIDETLKSKYKECDKLWKIFEPKLYLNDGFDLFIEQIIVKEDYDNNDIILVSERYNFNLKMIKLCNDLALWNQVNKLNNTLYSNLLLTNQFIKIELAGSNPLVYLSNSPLLDNSMYRFLELLTNNLNNYQKLGYKMFYNNLNIETKRSFINRSDTKYNFPIFGKNFLGCFLMLWDHTIFKLFTKRTRGNEPNYNNLELKSRYLLPIKNFIDTLVDQIETNKEPKLLSNINLKDYEYDIDFTHEKLSNILKEMEDQLKATTDVIPTAETKLSEDYKEEKDNYERERDFLNKKTTAGSALKNSKNKYKEKIQSPGIYLNETKYIIFKFENIFKKHFSKNTIAFLSSVKKYLENKDEHEPINFLYIIFKIQEDILSKINKTQELAVSTTVPTIGTPVGTPVSTSASTKLTGSSAGNKILKIFKNNSDNIEHLEKILKNYIEIFPFSLDIKSRVTPFVNNIKQNKVLKLFVNKLAFVVDKYLGNNIYRLLERLFAKEIVMKIQEPVATAAVATATTATARIKRKDKIKNVILKLDQIKKYLVDGEFSKSMIKTILNIQDDKYRKLEYETIDSVFENLISKIDTIIVGENSFLNEFKTSGKLYYKQLYQKFILNAYSVVINYNRFVINQYKYIRSIHEMIKLIDFK